MKSTYLLVLEGFSHELQNIIEITHHQEKKHLISWISFSKVSLVMSLEFNTNSDLAVLEEIWGYLISNSLMVSSLHMQLQDATVS